MAATPFKGLLVLQRVSDQGPVNLALSFSDVNTQFATFDDLNALAQLTVPEDSGGYKIVDFTLTAAGVDTSRLQLRKGTTDTAIILRDSQLANLTTDVVSRTQGIRGSVLGKNLTYFFRQLT